MSKKEFLIVVSVASVICWLIAGKEENYYLSPMYWWWSTH